MRSLLCRLCLVAFFAQAGPAELADVPQDADGFFKRGAERYRRLEFDLAIEDFNELIRLAPDVALAHSARAAVWFAKKEYDKAGGDDKKPQDSKVPRTSNGKGKSRGKG